MTKDYFEIIPTYFGPLTAINTDIRITDELRKYGHWEFNELLEILKEFDQFYPDASGAILDIGCNIGTWILPIANRYSNPIRAFDCQPLTVACVNKTIELNQLTNVQVDCCVMSDVPGQTISYNEIDYNWGANFGAYEFEPPHRNPDFNGRITQNQVKEISTQTVDSLNIPISLIKIDVEGMELKVLKGAQKTLEQMRPFVVFEHHKTDRQLAEQLLTDLGYINYNSIGLMSMFIPKEKYEKSIL